MADPLSRYEDRQLHVVLDLAHLEGRGMPMAHQIVDEPAILGHLLRAPAIGHARRLDHGAVVAHIVDDANEAVIKNRDRLIEDLLERRDAGPPRLTAAFASPV